MRKCPACSVPLAEVDLHRETVDRCPSCNGIYFDAGELESIVRLVRLAQGAALEEDEIETVSPQESARALACPADGTIMEKQDIGGTVVDRCPLCRGIWLDNGEIVALRMVENHIKENILLYVRLGG
jgi:Zn-finger nucleic acid-binding protein